MEKPNSKTNVLKILVAAWILFSFGYIVNDQWKTYQAYQLKQAYNKGVEDSVRKLISNSESCKPIPVFSEDKEIQLISLECLQNIANSPEEPELAQ